MLVLGIDLAAQPASTGVVVLERDPRGRWVAEVPEGEPDDDALVRWGAGADKVGVDVPLGWPAPFVEAVAAHLRHDPWPATEDRRPLTHRRTDDVVVEQGWGRPMSASADRLGSVAMRGALLQREWALRWGGAAPRDGSGRLAEVYPAAALRVWHVTSKGYKAAGPRSVAAREVRSGIVADLSRRCGPRLDLAAVAGAAVESDHVLDALLSAMVAVSVLAGTTLRPRDADELRSALAEGWIHVPTAPLEELALSRA